MIVPMIRNPPVTGPCLMAPKKIVVHAHPSLIVKNALLLPLKQMMCKWIMRDQLFFLFIANSFLPALRLFITSFGNRRGIVNILM